MKPKEDYDEALAYLEASLKISQEIGDRKGEGVTLNNISQIHTGKRSLRRSVGLHGSVS